MEQNILEFENVTGKKGKLRKKFCLENINFAIPAGYICGLMGNNGAGKTTLFRYIMESKQLYNGTIRINGADIRENHTEMMNQIGFVSEDRAFFEERTAAQNVELLSPFYRDFDKELFNKAMEEMGVSVRKTYCKMSRGEKLKFQMAFAMAHHPVLYLLDEVTVGMDPVFRMDFFKILQRVIAEENASVFMSSHIASEMERKADYVCILENGKMVNFGESIEVLPEQRVEAQKDA